VACPSSREDEFDSRTVCTGHVVAKYNMTKQKLYHYIYKTTCSITGKFYIGMHSTDNLEDGYLGSGKILGYSRRKYGDENHMKEILTYCSSRDELKQKEREIVNEDLLKQPLNINLKYGGAGGQSSEISRLSWQNESRRQSTSARLKKQWQNEEYRANISKHSSVTMKKAHADGKIKYDIFTGKTHSDEARAKISKAVSLAQSGEKNSQFGVKRIGINKDGKIKKVLPTEVQEYIDSGWKKGFK
jgi:hypothetical protein